jgi:hypothetical protein
MARTGARFLLVVAAFVAVLAAACNALLDFDSFTVTIPDAGGPSADAAADGGCVDPAGFGGRGCWRCPATTNDQLLSACTDSKFETFDNAARIKSFDPTTPRPPLEDGGATPPKFDAGPSSGGPTLLDGGCFEGPNPVLVLGATGFPLETVQKAMGDTATVVYLETGSCFGVGAAAANTPKFGEEPASVNTKQAVYFDRNQDGRAVSCRVPDGVSIAADIALSGSFPDTCSGSAVSPSVTLPPNTTLPTDWKDFVAVINPIMFAVPATSNERAISAEAAYRVFGFGSGTGSLARTVEPWIDENFIFRRTASSGTQQAIGRFLQIPAGAFRGTDAGGSSAMRRAFQQTTDVQRTIGLNSSEIVDADRSSMKSLAYQHFGQPVAFYPDSDPGAFDRRNIRDGHYLMWLALHAFARIDNNQDVVSSHNPDMEKDGAVVGPAGKTRAERDLAVRRLVGVLTGQLSPPVPTVDLFGALKRLGDVPGCAMRVTRPKDGADLVPFTPATSCACAFEAASPGSVPAGCKPCTGPADCSGTGKPTCSFGYCE